MRRYWYRRILIIIVVFSVSVGGGYYLIEDNQQSLNKEVSANASGELLIPGGMPIGIYLETDGVLVLGTDAVTAEDGLNYEPASHLVKEGDYIVALDEVNVKEKSELVRAMKQLDHDEVILKVRRAEQLIDIKMKAVKCEDEGYKLGIWVRDNAQGLGTVTFLNSDSQFGALGHGIHDVDTNELLNISEGMLYTTSIKDIQKGEDGLPGGMEGVIVYNNYNILGNINQNTKEGIFGTVERVEALFSDAKPMEAAKIEDIKTEKATIRCAVDGNVKEYGIRITKVDNNAKEVNKKLELEVTDSELLALTGGIVQGMSGSPIIQDGKIIGAVTHVFVQNPEKGYGVFIGDMLKHIE